MSTCDGPPFMNRWTTCLALPAKCGGLGASAPAPRRAEFDSAQRSVGRQHAGQAQHAKAHAAAAQHLAPRERRVERRLVERSVCHGVNR